MLSSINTADSAELTTLFAEYSETKPLLKVSLNDYASDSVLINRLFMDLRGGKEDGKFVSLAEIEETFLNASNLAKLNTINRSTAYTEIENVLYVIPAEHKADFQLTEKGAFEEAFDNVRSGMPKQRFESLAEITGALDMMIVMARINVGTRETLTDMLKQYQSLIGIDATLAYQKHDATEMNKRFLGYGKFTSIAAISSAFNNAVSSLQLSGQLSGGGSGSNGGGSGSSSGGSGGKAANMTLPAVSDVDVDLVPMKTFEFNDISDALWAMDSIYELAKRNIISGTPEGDFLPNNHITREEFVKLAVLAFNIDSGEGSVEFNDVNQSQWSYKYILAAYKAGVVRGFPDGTFKGGDNITREELCVVITRCLNYADIELDRIIEPFEFYDDDSISDYAKESVNYLASAGIINGTGYNLLLPADFATRAQVAKIIHSIIVSQEAGE